MDNVVPLPPQAKARPAGKGTTPRRRRRRSKTALVLGGGGFTGAVYEIGALRALDLLSVNKTVNQFDVYVGTSAGSFVAAMLANGITPEEMARVVNQQVPTPFRDIDVGTLLRPNIVEFAKKGALLPVKAAYVLRQLAGQLRSSSAMDVILGLAEGLPSGLYSGAGVESYVRQVLSDPDRSNDFRLLERDLYLAATDLDTYQRLHEMARHWEKRYPGVDIVLIEPEQNDELMFQPSIMNFSARVEIARHGFESVTVKLAAAYDRFRRICERHGIEISATRVRKVIKHFAAEPEKTRAWRRILEQTTGTLLRQ